jgi:hypothetical protein
MGKVYTEEQLQSIRENLKKAFGIDYLPLNNRVDNLFKNKSIKLQEDDILHVHLPYGKEIWDMNPGWYRIKVTYIRSGVVFFKYIDTKHKHKEDHADIESDFIGRACMGTIRMKDVSIKECNIPLIKIERDEHDPFPVELIDENGDVVKVL